MIDLWEEPETVITTGFEVKENKGKVSIPVLRNRDGERDEERIKEEIARYAFL